MENLKNLYHSYSSSDEYMKLQEMPEVEGEKAKVHNFFRQHFKDEDFFTTVRLTTSYAYSYEMRGFTIGFSYAVRIMAECFAGRMNERTAAKLND